MDRAKPFDIPKREVWEAYKRVRANQGAAGVDGQSIADFEADLALDAVGVARRRCWRYDWVLDLDIKSFFDGVPLLRLAHFDYRKPLPCNRNNDHRGRQEALKFGISQYRVKAASELRLLPFL